MIEVKHLTKDYGNHVAVRDLSFTIEEGHIYGFLGPNGAGKSTTMNIITGCLSATEGSVTIGGYDIFEQPKEAKKLIGYLPEIPPLYVDQTPYEYLEFVAEAKGFRGKEKRFEIERVVRETHIENVLFKVISHLSKGYRQRVGIAQALLGNPQIIILDEPTVGLDPAQIIEIRDLIKELGKSHTVILSSHILPEVQAICDRILIIHRGNLVAFDTPENIRASLSSDNHIEIEAETDAETAKYLLANIEGIESVSIAGEPEEGPLRISVTAPNSDMKEICRAAYLAFADAHIVLTRLNPVELSLEDIFLELTRDKDVEEAEGEGTEEEEESEPLDIEAQEALVEAAERAIAEGDGIDMQDSAEDDGRDAAELTEDPAADMAENAAAETQNPADEKKEEVTEE